MRVLPCFALFSALLLCAKPLVANEAAPTSASLPPASASPTPPSTAGSGSIDSSVVKVFSTVRYPDPFRPWTKQAPTELTGSGVVIEGKRILTNAHVVLYASQVQVQANQDGDKISATVEALAPGIDLAILKLDDESIFDKHPPVTLARTLPAVKDAVLVYGYPTGGTTLSITKGIISRIEFASYNFPVSGLRIQIDAAINPGNSGGPAFVGDQMIGIAFSRLGGGDNIGYIIPNEEIELFQADAKDGRYDGKPAIYDELQTLENPALREFLKIDKSVAGMVVHRPLQDRPDYPLKKWDVITKIGDTPLDDQGMVKLSPTLRIQFRYLVQRYAKQGRLPLSIVRNGKPLDISLPAETDHKLLIPDLHGDYPPYFVLGPLVFSKATTAYLGFLQNNAALTTAFSFVGSPLITRRGDLPAFPDEELVIVSSPFFPHKLAKGYSNPSAGVVASINGQSVHNLRHLVAILRDMKDDSLIVELDHRGSETYVFSRRELLAATDEILTDNGVRSQGSADMLEVWNARPAKADAPPPADRSR